MAPAPWSEISTFRRVHHVHLLPRPPRLLGKDDPSKQGGTAISRYAGVFALGLDHVARIIGLAAGHYVSVGTELMLFGYGTGQGAHALRIDKRTLKALKAERAVLSQNFPEHTPLRHVQAMRRQNLVDKREMRYWTVLDAMATFGATVVGVGLLFRPSLLGSVVTHFQAPLLILGSIGFGPLVLPSVIGAIDRGVRATRTHHKRKAMVRYLGNNPTGVAKITGQLFDKRQKELRDYYLMDGFSRAVLAAGASVAVFTGPIGLIPTVPAAIAVLISEKCARRFIRLKDALPLPDRLLLTNDNAIQTEVAATHRDYACLFALRKARRKYYPRGWGTPLRSLMRAVRHVRGNQNDNPATKFRVLDAIRTRQRKPSAYAADLPAMDVLAMMRTLRMQEAFARALLQDKKIRKALLDHGVVINNKKWSLEQRVVALHIDDLRTRSFCTVNEDKLVQAYYATAEEVLLCTGKTEIHRRQRALLDFYDRFTRTPQATPRALPASSGAANRRV